MWRLLECGVGPHLNERMLETAFVAFGNQKSCHFESKSQLERPAKIVMAMQDVRHLTWALVGISLVVFAARALHSLLR